MHAGRGGLKRCSWKEPEAGLASSTQRSGYVVCGIRSWVAGANPAYVVCGLRSWVDGANPAYVDGYQRCHRCDMIHSGYHAEGQNMQIMRMAAIVLAAGWGIAAAGPMQPDTFDVWLR